MKTKTLKPKLTENNKNLVMKTKTLKHVESLFVFACLFNYFCYYNVKIIHNQGYFHFPNKHMILWSFNFNTMYMTFDDKTHSKE